MPSVSVAMMACEAWVRMARCRMVTDSIWRVRSRTCCSSVTFSSRMRAVAAACSLTSRTVIEQPGAAWRGARTGASDSETAMVSPAARRSVVLKWRTGSPRAMRSLSQSMVQLSWPGTIRVAMWRPTASAAATPKMSVALRFQLLTMPSLPVAMMASSECSIRADMRAWYSPSRRRWRRSRWLAPATSRAPLSMAVSSVSWAVWRAATAGASAVARASVRSRCRCSRSMATRRAATTTGPCGPS